MWAGTNIHYNSKCNCDDCVKTSKLLKSSYKKDVRRKGEVDMKETCERIQNAMNKGQDALAVKILNDKLEQQKQEERDRVYEIVSRNLELLHTYTKETVLTYDISKGKETVEACRESVLTDINTCMQVIDKEVKN